MKRITLAALAVALACSPDKSGTGNGASSGPQRAGSIDLTGAGATFPYPLYSKWFSDYAAKSGIKINYQSIGSGGGIRQFSEQTVDFGATDDPMTDEEMSHAKGGRVLHVPIALGGVAITYNLPGVTQPLKLSGPLAADMFLGKVTKWNDPAIAGLNPGVKLPDQDILVVHRSDGSGTSYVFTDYLAAVSPAWANGPKKGKEVSWPIGLGGRGNEGVAGQVKQTIGALGYVELAYAKQNRLPAALIRNSAGNYVAPSSESITAAATDFAAKLPPNTDYRISIVNAPGANSYPISSFTWILAYTNQPDSVKGKKLVDFLRWALTEGERETMTLNYAPLPAFMATQVMTLLDSIKLGSPR